MYELDSGEANVLVGTLAVAFESQLADEVDSLPSHAELVRYATRTGHRTRPVGCLLGASAVGGDWQTALNAAVAVELVHKASVIRDDIVDGDETRSGQTAVHIAYGVPRALAVSDVLWSHGLRLVGRGLHRDTASTCREQLTATLYEMASGQLEDVAPGLDRGDIAERALVDEMKTGALSGCACALGAAIGGGDPSQIHALERYGRKLGTAFQVINDVRNLSGAEGERRVASDVRLRRDTVLSAFARTKASVSMRSVFDRARFGADDLTDDEVRAIRDAMIACGAREFGEQLAQELIDDARAQLEPLPLGPAREVLDALTREVLLAYAF